MLGAIRQQNKPVTGNGQRTRWQQHSPKRNQNNAKRRLVGVLTVNRTQNAAGRVRRNQYAVQKPFRRKSSINVNGVFKPGN